VDILSDFIDAGSIGINAAQGNRAVRVARYLSNRITEHQLEAGSKLPAENAMARHFGVSRTVIREAVAMLKAEGLVETLQGSGTFVLSSEDVGAGSGERLTRASLQSLMDLLNVRRMIEAEIAGLAAEKHRPEDLLRIDTALARLQQADQEGRSGVAEDRAFHASIADATGNVYWRSITRSLAKPIDIAISVTRVNEAMREGFAAAVAEEHAAIRDAVAARDVPQARAAATRHLDQAKARVMSADQTFWRTAGAPVVNLPGALIPDA